MASPPQLAAWLLEELRVRSPAEIDVRLLAQHCGATIVTRPLNGCDARIVGRGDRAFITVDHDARIGRRRFSAAHELGHWLYDREHISKLALVAARCSDIDGGKSGHRSAREDRADKFAAELLMPIPLFREASRNRPLTITEIEGLADIFRTSFTATAFRLVDVEPRPSVFLELKADGERRFFRRHAELPGSLWPRKKVERGTLASQLTRADPRKEGLVDATLWFEHDGAEGYEVVESSQLLPSGQIRTLLSWEKDEAMLLAL